MLAFVIRLKSKKVSSSWEQVSKLFERTLKSVCNQTSPNFRVIVVCHEKPCIEFNHSHVEYIEVDFERPGQNLEGKRLDKARKSFIGIVRAQELNPSHIMPVDADDCISNNLAKFVNQNPQDNGWYVNKGYVYKEGDKCIYLRQYRFNQSCGTSRIIRNDLYQLSENLTDVYQVPISILWELIRHQNKKVRGGEKLKQLPFIGAVYNIGNQENIYLTDFATFHGTKVGFRRTFISRVKDLRNYRLLTESVKKEFGLYALN